MTESPEIPPYLNRVIQLPHWDRVAFAAFCARLTLPIYTMGVEKVPDDRAQLLWEGIANLEYSAERGKCYVEAEKLRTDFTIARGAARRAVYDRDDESTPTEEEEDGLTISEQVVDICEYAVETMETPEEDSAPPAYMAYFWTETLLKSYDLVQFLEVTDSALEWLETHPFKKSWRGRSGASLRRFRERIGELVDSL